MSHKWLRLMLVLAVLISLGLAACGNDDKEEATNAPAESDTTDAYAGKKVVWVDSYHEGYAWSDSIQVGIEEVLANTGVELLVLRLDTRNITDPDARQPIVDDAKAQIDAFGPDVIIASDDNAQSLLIVPNYKDTDIPVVFCGVNWDASIYGYPASNVTGMVEVDLLAPMAQTLDAFTAGERYAVIADDVETTHKDVEKWLTIFPDMEVFLTTDYDEFKQAYLDLQERVDLLFVANNIGVENWDEEDAATFFAENAKIPTASINTWMAPYVLLVTGKIGSEHGRYGAETALKILDGTPVSDIEVVRNKEGAMIVNLDVAGVLELALPPEWLRNAEVIGGEAVAAE